MVNQTLGAREVSEYYMHVICVLHMAPPPDTASFTLEQHSSSTLPILRVQFSLCRGAEQARDVRDTARPPSSPSRAGVNLFIRRLLGGKGARTNIYVCMYVCMYIYKYISISNMYMSIYISISFRYLFWFGTPSMETV